MPTGFLEFKDKDGVKHWTNMPFQVNEVKGESDGRL